MIRISILELVPGAGYQGTTYDQWIVAEIAEREFKVFDKLVMIASTDHVGTTRDVLLLAHVSEVTRLEEPAHEITPGSGHGVVVSGRVEEIGIPDQWHDSPERTFVQLDVGPGTLFVDVEVDGTGSDGSFDVGDYIHVAAYRLDLLEIE